MRRYVWLECLWIWMGMGVSSAWACNCFPPELRAKTAQEALDKSRVAVLAQVQSVNDQQTAHLVVLEAYKGLVAGAGFEAVQDVGQCGEMRFNPGEKLLFMAFKDHITACDKHPPEHYMVEEFRKMQAK